MLEGLKTGQDLGFLFWLKDTKSQSEALEDNVDGECWQQKAHVSKKRDLHKKFYINYTFYIRLPLWTPLKCLTSIFQEIALSLCNCRKQSPHMSTWYITYYLSFPTVHWYTFGALVSGNEPQRVCVFMEHDGACRPVLQCGSLVCVKLFHRRKVISGFGNTDNVINPLFCSWRFGDKEKKSFKLLIKQYSNSSLVLAS